MNILWILDYLKVCPDPQITDNPDFINIFYEFVMNYPVENLRQKYFENKKKEMERVTRDELRDLGYDEEDLIDVEI